MRSIADYLKKFENLRPSKNTLEKESLKIIKDIIGCPSGCIEVKFKSPNLIISADPAFKSEIFLRKEEINKEITRQLKNPGLNILFR